LAVAAKIGAGWKHPRSDFREQLEPADRSPLCRRLWLARSRRPVRARRAGCWEAGCREAPTLWATKLKRALGAAFFGRHGSSATRCEDLQTPGCRDPRPPPVAAAALSLSLYQATARLPGASGVRFLARWMRILSPLTDPIWQVRVGGGAVWTPASICMCVYILSCMYACILDLASECRQWDSGPASRIRGLHQLRRAAQPTRSWSWRGGDCANSRLRSHLGAQPKGRGHTRLRTYI